MSYDLFFLKKEEAAAEAKTANFEEWLPFVRVFRTLCAVPPAGLRRVLEQLYRPSVAG